MATCVSVYMLCVLELIKQCFGPYWYWFVEAPFGLKYVACQLILHTQFYKGSLKKNHFFVTNVKPPLTPPPPRVTKNHPLFFTWKTLSEELKCFSLQWGSQGLACDPSPRKNFSWKIFSYKPKTVNPRGWRLQVRPLTPPLEKKKSLKML